MEAKNIFLERRLQSEGLEYDEGKYTVKPGYELRCTSQKYEPMRFFGYRGTIYNGVLKEGSEFYCDNSLCTKIKSTHELADEKYCGTSYVFGPSPIDENPSEYNKYKI